MRQTPYATLDASVERIGKPLLRLSSSAWTQSASPAWSQKVAASGSILAQRLTELEQRQVLVHGKLPPPASAPVYELTAWGYEAEPITSAMGRWAARSPRHDPNRPISGVSLLLSFRTMLDRSRCGDIDAHIGFRFGEDVYGGHLTRGTFVIAQGDPPDASLRFAGSPMALGAAVYGGAPLAQLEADHALSIVGDLSLAERFVTLFPLPRKFGR
jgi:hypothetical protein